MIIRFMWYCQQLFSLNHFIFDKKKPSGIININPEGLKKRKFYKIIDSFLHYNRELFLSALWTYWNSSLSHQISNLSGHVYTNPLSPLTYPNKVTLYCFASLTAAEVGVDLETRTGVPSLTIFVIISEEILPLTYTTLFIAKSSCPSFNRIPVILSKQLCLPISSFKT